MLVWKLVSAYYDTEIFYVHVRSILLSYLAILEALVWKLCYVLKYTSTFELFLFTDKIVVNVSLCILTTT